MKNGQKLEIKSQCRESRSPLPFLMKNRLFFIRTTVEFTYSKRSFFATKADFPPPPGAGCD